ncbi:hypothetical protein [Clostridium sp. ZS2-4]|uniref:hypothetical protein n=1 Tax=Clostridium sp. ZS2-4 TaxID=2987703 RepID=UPI00227C785D|nr:hypothetical protein [Clostridium sp. ZS2-4]MCY6355556.1 hypothetical protein [Clostridium sp. ZS2-4]
MTMALNTTAFTELTYDEMMVVNGGAWSWGAFFGSIFEGAKTGYEKADPNGTMKLPLIGDVSASFGQAFLGAINGGVDYLICGWC